MTGDRGYHKLWDSRAPASGKATIQGQADVYTRVVLQ